MASLKLVLTFEDIAPFIVGPIGIDPVMLEGAFGIFPCFALVVAVGELVVFLDPAVLPCANTSELTAAVNSVTAATNIAPYMSTFLLTCLEFVVIVVITDDLTKLLL